MSRENDLQVSDQAFPRPRLLSIDVYRGLVMFLLAAGAVALTPKIVGKIFPDSSLWAVLATQWTHADWQSSVAEWNGFRLWDMIQPSFMFLVGVSVPFSYGKRKSLGQSYGRMFGHACYRAAFLILLGVVLRSLPRHVTSTYWTFEDVVSQIGLGYLFLFLLWDRTWRVQVGVGAAILLLYWAFWQFWPGVSSLFGLGDSALAGWPTGYDRNPVVTNPGQGLDSWLLNSWLFQRPGGFTNHSYYTLNFIPSLVTMIGGLLAGHLLKSNHGEKRKTTVLLVAGLVSLLLGISFDWMGVCPIIKKIWTPSWVLYSGGICAIVLGLIYALVDVWGFRRGATLFVVFGANSIAIYILTWTLCRPLVANLGKHLNHTIFYFAPPEWRQLLVSALAFTLVWLGFFWLYKRKIFIRI
ncbi:MAG: hypothetical protein P8K78_09975 [Pirellulales bacterium]|nr:hypothetical protein [Pirellulales bacterium]